MTDLTGQAVVAAPPRYQWKRVTLLVGMVVGMAVCGIGVLVWLGLNIGVTALLVGVGAALIPVPVLVACSLWLDRYGPEPIKYLAMCLAWGACVATAVALVLNEGSAALARREHLPSTLVAPIGARGAEETMKALGPLLLFLFRRKAFSGVVDGIVYCGLSATGFAMVENILYLGGKGYAAGADHAGVAGGVSQVIGVFFVRIALSGFAHPLFTAMTGIGLGVAARSADRRGQGEGRGGVRAGHVELSRPAPPPPGAAKRARRDAISAYGGAYPGGDPMTPPAHWDGQRYHVRFPDGSVRTLDPPPQPVVPVPVLLLPYR